MALLVVAGPAAVAVSLTFESKNREATTTISDESWPGVGSRGLVPAEQWGLERRTAEVSPFDNYEQWQQAKGDAFDQGPKFWLAPGFEVSRIRQAAADEGSWIALAFDRQGRATISREDSGLLRVTLAADRGSVTRVEPSKVDLPECRGLMYIDDRLYANANAPRAARRIYPRRDCRFAGLSGRRSSSVAVNRGEQNSSRRVLNKRAGVHAVPASILRAISPPSRRASGPEMRGRSAP